MNVLIQELLDTLIEVLDEHGEFLWEFLKLEVLQD
jgi:hypothetical protein